MISWVRSKSSPLVDHARTNVQTTIAFYQRLSPLYKVLVIATGAVLSTVAVLMLVFHDALLHQLVVFANAWKNIPGGWLILFALLIVISFPPLIGYSTLGTMSGMMYGFPGGWPLLASATVLGSLLSFLTFRYLLRDRAERLAKSNAKFAALSSTLEQDKLTLLWMIRLCPLPYSFSNGALSSIPSVSVGRFALATAFTTPKLLMHIFIGDRVARLGDDNHKRSKAVDILAIAITGILGTVTAVVIYRRTMERAAFLERTRADAQDYDPVDTFELSDEDDFDIDVESDQQPRQEPLPVTQVSTPLE